MIEIKAFEENNKKQSIDICLAIRHFTVNDRKLPDGAEKFRVDSETTMLKGMNSVMSKIKEGVELREIIPAQGEKYYY